MRFPVLLSCLLLGFPVTGFPDDSLAALVSAIQKEKGTRTASIGVCLVPLDGEPSDAFGYQIDQGLVPASTMKAITTATANEVLGSDYRFKTEVQTAGVLGEEGTLKGSVVIRGGGDPTLGESHISRTFAVWQEALTKAGIKKVEGSIVGDASIFGTKLIPDSWQWNDIGNYYGAGASGLTFHQNQFFCSFRTPTVGGIAGFIGTDPQLPGVEFINEMRVGSPGSGDQGYIYGVPYGKVFYLRGTVPAGSGSFTIRGSLPDPAFFCARAFTKHLNQFGLEVTGEPTTLRLMMVAGESLAARKIIHEESSDSLESLIVLTNHKSVNLRAECMHRAIGLKEKGAGTTLDASTAVTAYWAGKGIDMTGFYMADGCGLSRSNTVTAKQMALIHYHAAKGDQFEAFYNSLPVAGRSGTLKSIGGGTSAEGRIRAKSGTLDRIKTYAGYVNARSGKRYAFAIFINNYSGESSDAKSKVVRIWTKMVDL